MDVNNPPCVVKVITATEFAQSMVDECEGWSFSGGLQLYDSILSSTDEVVEMDPGLFDQQYGEFCFSSLPLIRNDIYRTVEILFGDKNSVVVPMLWKDFKSFTELSDNFLAWIKTPLSKDTDPRIKPQPLGFIYRRRWDVHLDKY